ncbi:AbrB family transcriptional regulator [Martelella lutilitoris]|uniref:AbrB family transcriptional regulator n=1 Tax=Martelella lutilitoris TaxID=2583532 RepID=A0A5C4JSS8_9HYPH|nr:AbrB family transcriptional regulator [Martelella lutilitoris]TNB48463.1 AbrB family transcriptional regulator [Martelella lutilitoris]
MKTGVALATLGVASAGAVAGTLLGLPAPQLLGSTIATSAAAVLGLKLGIPTILRNLGFAVIGISLGSGVTSHLFADIARFPLSIAILTLSVVAIMGVAGFLLKRLLRVSAQTALLATSPGALSYVISLTDGKDIDLRAVMMLQSMRVLLITVLLPLMVGAAGHGAGGPVAPGVSLPLWFSLALIAGAYGLGHAAARYRLPSAFLLCGLVLSGAFHGLDLVAGRPPWLIMDLAFVIAGALIGTRFVGFTLAEFRRFAVYGLLVSFVAVSISALASAFTAHILAMPFGQVWVAFAPGGVEAMASMALEMHYDPVYVATHHVYRIVMLMVTLPILVNLIGRR